MFNLLALFKRRKPQIIPFSTYEKNRQLPHSQCKILPFKANLNYASNGNMTGECKITSFEYRDFEYPDQCKLDFIWDHLL